MTTVGLSRIRLAAGTVPVPARRQPTKLSSSTILFENTTWMLAFYLYYQYIASSIVIVDNYENDEANVMSPAVSSNRLPTL